MSVAIVDVGTNSTRLLVADGDAELERHSIVTRLGDGVDASGRLAADAQERVLSVVDEYLALIRHHSCTASVALLTSAVRDAANGAEFAERVRARGLDARVISGEEEARLTFTGATASRPADDLAVIDIGGGSTEIVTRDVSLSTQIGVVRHGERHDDLDALAADVRRELLAAQLPRVRAAVAVAGTPTSAAGIDLGGYDRERVEGYVLSVTRLEQIRDMLAALSPAERREVKGLHPDRAGVMLPGLTILLVLLDLLGLDRVEVSERDLLWGAAAELSQHGP
jgi:exopolyphosphatase/guanosine-5'-triphosphate,3'-diphosphate pyrophosphatase